MWLNCSANNIPEPRYLNISVLSMMGCVLDNMYVVVIWCVWLFSIIILQNGSLGALFDVFIGLISIKVTGKTLRGSTSAKKQKVNQELVTLDYKTKKLKSIYF